MVETERPISASRQAMDEAALKDRKDRSLKRKIIGLPVLIVFKLQRSGRPNDLVADAASFPDSTL